MFPAVYMFSPTMLWRTTLTTRHS